MTGTQQQSIDNFTLLCLIGKGNFGKIYLVKEISTQKVYAMKVIKKKYLSRQNKT